MSQEDARGNQKPLFPLLGKAIRKLDPNQLDGVTPREIVRYLRMSMGVSNPHAQLMPMVQQSLDKGVQEGQFAKWDRFRYGLRRGMAVDGCKKRRKVYSMCCPKKRRRSCRRKRKPSCRRRRKSSCRRKRRTSCKRSCIRRCPPGMEDSQEGRQEPQQQAAQQDTPSNI